MFKDLKDAEAFITQLTRAQSMVGASIVRALLDSGALTESDLRKALEATEQAALQRRTPETPAVLGLVEVLRTDLGLTEGTDPGGSPPRPS